MQFKVYSVFTLFFSADVVLLNEIEKRTPKALTVMKAVTVTVTVILTVTFLPACRVLYKNVNLCSESHILFCLILNVSLPTIVEDKHQFGLPSQTIKVNGNYNLV